MNNTKRIADLEKTLHERREAAEGPKLVPLYLKIGTNPPEVAAHFPLAKGFRHAEYMANPIVIHLGDRALWDGL